MQDEMIVDLYWKRDESAISETERKYGRYLSKIAYNIYYILEFIVVLHGFLFIILAFCFNNRSPKFKLLDKEASRKAI